MTHRDLTRLMHEVLDGAASAEEARELDRLVAADPAARAQFEELKRLFASLKTMPQAAPPEGLVTEVLARIPRRYTARARLRQLSSRWRVLQLYSGRVRGRSPSRATRSNDSQLTLSRRNKDMSRLTSVFSGKRKVWVGGAIALAAVMLVAWYLDFPPTGEAAGTIAPAKRSVAEQPGASDVDGTGQSGTQPTQPGSAGDARDASRDARDARDSSRDARDASRDARDARDASRDARDARDSSRDARDASRDARDARDASRDARDARDARDSSRDARDASRDARDASRDARDASRDATRDSSSQ